MNSDFITAFKKGAQTQAENRYYCLPAEVVGVANLDKGIIDVKPIIERVYDDGSVNEVPTILSVPIAHPHTRNSAILLPVSQGDSVLLVFSQRDISAFKGGARSSHEPETRRTHDINDAFAILGISPLEESPYAPQQHSLPHSTSDVVVVHNLGTSSENEVRLKKNGDVEITTPTNFVVNAKTAQFNVDKLVNTGDNIVEKNSTVVGNQVVNGNSTVNGTSSLIGGGTAKGISIDGHRHHYTDDGNDMITDPPI